MDSGGCENIGGDGWELLDVDVGVISGWRNWKKMRGGLVRDWKLFVYIGQTSCVGKKENRYHNL